MVGHARALLVAVVVLGLLAACSDDSPDPDPVRPKAHGSRYVALGDSAVSGPGIGKEDPASPGCGRSSRNYPSLVAEKLGVKSFTDVSCGGATSEIISEGGETSQGVSTTSQLRVVAADTQLVSLSVGGNDEGAIAVFYKCAFAKKGIQERQCEKYVSKTMPDIYPKVRKNVVALLNSIEKLAPDARVMLVGYLHIAPAKGDCKALRMTDVTREAALEWEAKMNATLRDAAEEAGAEFVDVRKISRGHDACAGDDRWVNGIKDVPGDGAFLHPNAAGMAAVAAQVVKAVKSAE